MRVILATLLAIALLPLLLAEPHSKPQRTQRLEPLARGKEPEWMTRSRERMRECRTTLRQRVEPEKEAAPVEEPAEPAAAPPPAEQTKEP